LRPKPPKDPRKDLLVDLIQLHKDKPEFALDYLRRMAITNFGAGHETMCSALTCIMAMIGSHPDVQARIADEIVQTVHPMRFENAVRLQYTQASIKEAQRLYPVIGMSLPRKVPAGGLDVHGRYFPAGTTVGCNPFALHRNSNIFGDDVGDFKPERWLDAEAAKAMERYNLTWGGAPRNCPGRHLAELIMYKAVPALIKEFRVEVTMPPEGSMRFYFLAMMTDVRVRFIPREKS
jgi:cytochrome P450